MNILVLFGVTGDLARKKVLPALARIQGELMGKAQQAEARGDFSIEEHIYCIGVARKDKPTEEFGALQHASYIQGDLDTVSTYTLMREKIMSSVQDHIEMHKKDGGRNIGSKTEPTTTDIRLTVYSSLPPDMHVLVGTMVHEHCIASLRKEFENRFSLDIRFMIEKPLGNDLAGSEFAFKKLGEIYASEELYFVDHYLVKEPLIELTELAHAKKRVIEGIAQVKAIKAVLYEKQGVDGRGKFYDAVGALYDVGQNHLLQSLAQFMVAELDASDVSVNRADIIESLTIIPGTNSVRFGQYATYTDTLDVPKDSKTETFFHIAMHMQSADARLQEQLKGFADVQFIITAGKKLDIAKSGIEIEYKNGRIETIDFTQGKKDAYQILFEKGLGTDLESKRAADIEAAHKRFFAQPQEIIAGWNVVMKAKDMAKESDMVQYERLDDMEL